LYTLSLHDALPIFIAFGALILVKRHIGSDQFESFNGLGKKNPGLAFAITIAMLSLAGITLTAGFIGKFMMFSTVMNDYHTVLLILAAINAAVGIFYYFRIIVHMYFMKSEEEHKVVLPMNFQVVFAVAVVLTILLGIYPDLIIQLI